MNDEQFFEFLWGLGENEALEQLGFHIRECAQKYDTLRNWLSRLNIGENSVQQTPDIGLNIHSVERESLLDGIKAERGILIQQKRSIMEFLQLFLVDIDDRGIDLTELNTQLEQNQMYDSMLQCVNSLQQHKNKLRNSFLAKEDRTADENRSLLLTRITTYCHQINMTHDLEAATRERNVIRDQLEEATQERDNIRNQLIKAEKDRQELKEKSNIVLIITSLSIGSVVASTISAGIKLDDKNNIGAGVAALVADVLALFFILGTTFVPFIPPDKWQRGGAKAWRFVSSFFCCRRQSNEDENFRQAWLENESSQSGANSESETSDNSQYTFSN